MDRKWFFVSEGIIAFLILAIFFVLVSVTWLNKARPVPSPSFAEMKAEGYFYMLDDGLSLFKSEVKPEHIVATWVGLDYQQDAEGFLHLELFTLNKEIRVVSVKGKPDELFQFKGELLPEEGELKYWRPALRLPANRKIVRLSDVEILGYFLSGKRT